jgi:hypothetical protein
MTLVIIFSGSLFKMVKRRKLIENDQQKLKDFLLYRGLKMGMQGAVLVSVTHGMASRLWPNNGL